MDPATRPRFMTTYHGTYTPGLWSSIMTRGERVIAVSETVGAHIFTHYPATPRDRVRGDPPRRRSDRVSP
jgi:hypothetical protein